MRLPSFKERVGSLILLVLLLSLGLVDAALIEVKNKYLRIIGDSVSARFVIKTVDGDPDLSTDQNKLLLYEEYPPTSFTTLMIDGELYKFGDERGNFVLPIQTKDNTLIATWSVNNIDITQFLEFVDGPNTGRQDSVKISYMINNKSGKDSEIGVRILLDTFLGRNDGAPFRIPGKGEITTETIFTKDNVPSFWYSYDDLGDPTVRAQGTLRYEGLTPPDMVVFASWDRFNKYLWDFPTVEGRSFRRAVIGPLDSATANYWLPVKVPNGGKIGYSIMYGLYGATILRSDIFNISLSGPVNTKGEPVTIIADIQKKSLSPAQNCSAEFQLPMGLSFANNDKAVKDLGTINSNNVIKANWDVVPDGKARGEIEYKIIVKGTVDGKEYKTTAVRKLKVEGEAPPPPAEEPKQPQITLQKVTVFNFERINKVLTDINNDMKVNNDILAKINELLSQKNKIYEKTLKDQHVMQIQNILVRTNTYPAQILESGKDYRKVQEIPVTNK